MHVHVHASVRLHERHLNPSTMEYDMVAHRSGAGGDKNAQAVAQQHFSSTPASREEMRGCRIKHAALRLHTDGDICSHASRTCCDV